MENSEIIISVVLALGCFYFFSQHQRKHGSDKKPERSTQSATNALEKVPSNSALSHIIQQYKTHALHYQIYNAQNRKRVSITVEKEIFSHYPKVLSEPLLELPSELVETPEVITTWLKAQGAEVNPHAYIGRELANFLLNDTKNEAEKIVQNFIDQSLAQ